jgi:hypothetical protein
MLALVSCPAIISPVEIWAASAGVSSPSGQLGQHVVARVVGARPDEPGQVAAHRPGRAHALLGRRVAADADDGVALQELVVLGRHAEDLADHPHGQGKGQLRDEVGRPGPGEHRVDELVGDLLDDRPGRLDPLGGERARHHPAVAGVHRRVGVEHRAGTVGDGRGHALVPVRVAAHPLVDADARVGQQRPLLGVAGDDPRRAAVPDPHPRQRLVGRTPAQLGRRVERAAGLPRDRELHDLLVGRHCVGHGSPRYRNGRRVTASHGWLGRGRPRTRT